MGPGVPGSRKCGALAVEKGSWPSPRISPENCAEVTRRGGKSAIALGIENCGGTTPRADPRFVPPENLERKAPRANGWGRAQTRDSGPQSQREPHRGRSRDAPSAPADRQNAGTLGGAPRATVRRNRAPKSIQACRVAGVSSPATQAAGSRSPVAVKPGHATPRASIYRAGHSQDECKAAAQPRHGRPGVPEGHVDNEPMISAEEGQPTKTLVPAPCAGPPGPPC